MAEKKLQVVANGTQVQSQDVNLLGETSALADDRVFAEFLRMVPYNGTTVRKGVLPIAASDASTGVAQVMGAGASGKSRVYPFRALIGSRTAVATDAKKNWRDIRSTVVVGSTTLYQDVSHAANASGNPRWDLVYAAVAVDADSPTVTRKVKDPTSKVISSQSVVATVETTAALGVVTGTTAASPVYPATPADAAGIYYVPLAYVRIPNGFNATSTVNQTDIVIVAPSAPIAPAVGGASFSPANQAYALTTTQQQTWGSTGARRVNYVPSAAVGAETIFAMIDLTTGAVTHASGDTLDDRNWANRFCLCHVAIDKAGHDFPQGTPPNDASVFPTGYNQNSTLAFGGNRVVTTMAQTYTDTHSATVGAGKCTIAYLEQTSVPDMVAGTAVHVYADLADNFKVKVEYTGAPNRRLLVVIQFFPQF